MLSGKKTVHFVRHFQSTWNETEEKFKLTRLDKRLQSEEFVDAPLSAFGEEQADSIRQKIQDLNAEVAITSPLRRAIESCIRSSTEIKTFLLHICVQR